MTLKKREFTPESGSVDTYDTGLCSSFMQSIPTDLLEHSSDATGAAEIVAGVSGIPALHHLKTALKTHLFREAFMTLL